MISRSGYIEQLRPFIDKPQIKIITVILRDTVQRHKIRDDDQYPKYVVTMDDFWKDSIKGVKHLYISDFLLEGSL